MPSSFANNKLRIFILSIILGDLSYENKQLYSETIDLSDALHIVLCVLVSTC